MRTIVNRSHDPFYNQAFEEFVFQAFPEDDLFFLWQNSPAVVVGCYQNICREVSVPALQRLGIPVVRRSSGGGTVYHDLGNVNYTFLVRKDGPVDYDRCLLPMVEALNAIGVPARKNRVCDIAIGEQKISGSAQRVSGDRILQHGTLLFQSDLTALDQITTHHKNDCIQSKGIDSAICPVTNIRDHLARDMTLEEFQARLLARLVPGDAPPLTLTAAQEAEVRRLRDEKYRSWAWTWGKTPAFHYEKEGLFDGMPIRVSYDAKKGILSGVTVDCAALDGDKAAGLLSGARLDPEGLGALCCMLTGDRAAELLNYFL